MIYKDVPKAPGVYYIQNLLNDKIYIGSSNNLYRRLQQHIASARYIDALIYRAIRKHGIENFKFDVLLISNDYIEFEDIFIRLLKPEYNATIMAGGILKPNLGKKLSKEWIANLPKCEKHSQDTLIKLNKANKCGSVDVWFRNDKLDETILFDGWSAAGQHFKVLNNHPSSCFMKTRDGEFGKWKGWKIYIEKTQKKKVRIYRDDEEYFFESSYESDRYFDKWRGATSNAIINNSGDFYGYLAEYIK